MLNRFDPEREALAAMDFIYAGRRYVVGDVFDHKALGVSRFDLGGLWRASHIKFTERPAVAAGEGDSNPAASYAAEPGAIPGSATIVTVTPGETVAVETPAQRANKRKR